jgi:hypothetical protein
MQYPRIACEIPSVILYTAKSGPPDTLCGSCLDSFATHSCREAVVDFARSPNHLEILQNRYFVILASLNESCWLKKLGGTSRIGYSLRWPPKTGPPHPAPWTITGTPVSAMGRYLQMHQQPWRAIPTQPTSAPTKYCVPWVRARLALCTKHSVSLLGKLSPSRCSRIIGPAIPIVVKRCGDSSRSKRR